MDATRRTPPDHSPTKARPPAGVTAILLGLVCFVVGMLLDGGFLRGLFTGATVAPMVLGAYLIGSSRWRGTSSAKDGGPWLPSRDDSGDPTGR